MGEGVKFSVGRVTRFYIPLLVQAFSQSLSYPLVAGIVTHGKHGVDGLTAFCQGLMIMFMVGSFGLGLVTTGMIFAKTWLGYLSFRRLNSIMMVSLLALQLVPVVDPVATWVFGGLFGLSEPLIEVARQTLLYGSVMNAAFFARNVPMAVLFNNLESGKANRATLLRIVITFVLTVALPRAGLTGAGWGIFALTAGAWIETLLTWFYARPYVSRLPNRVSSPAQAQCPPALSVLAEQFRFTLPLSLGGFLLSCSPLIVAAFVSRSANAADMLAIHYITIGVANPVAFGALRMQTVAVEFPQEYPGDRRLLWFAVVAGLLLGVIPLVFSTPLVGNWYFGVFQNAPERIVETARLAIGIYSLICVIHAVRARVEGRAAVRRRPQAVMCGQVAYTVSLFIVCAILLSVGAQGWVIAITAIFVAPVCVAASIYAALWLGDRRERMVARKGIEPLTLGL